MLPVPTARGKGVLISPTVYGNVMLGPTAEDLTDRTDTATTADGLNGLLDKGRRLLPRLLDEEVTATYAGLRAAADRDDYLIEADPAQRYLLVGGIRSTGLTAGHGDRRARAGAAGRGRAGIGTGRGTAGATADAQSRRGVHPAVPGRRRDRGRPGLRAHRLLLRAGHRGRAAGRLPVGDPTRTLDGLRRRTRALNGRCQGFFCGAEVQSFLGEPR